MQVVSVFQPEGRGGEAGVVAGCCATAAVQVYLRHLFTASRAHVAAGEFNSFGEW